MGTVDPKSGSRSVVVAGALPSVVSVADGPVVDSSGNCAAVVSKTGVMAVVKETGLWN